MPSILTCPQETELLALAAGEADSEAIRMHLARCPRCRDRLARFTAEVVVLRASLADPAKANGHPIP
jgi:anti-sigma factor RsiW